MTYHRVCTQINMTGATRGAGTAYPQVASEFTPVFQWGLCYSMFSFMCMFCRSLFALLYFFLWPLCGQFFDLRILITPLVSSNSFYTVLKIKIKTQISNLMYTVFLWYNLHPYARSQQIGKSNIGESKPKVLNKITKIYC